MSDSFNLAVGMALVALASAPGSARAVMPLGEAEGVFREAERLCARDAGRLWGRDLCGPILLVDPTDRHVAANRPDAAGALRAEGGLYVGVLPREVIVANTPTEWAGVRWTQILWPLPSDTAERRVLIAHELFHRIQPELGLSRVERNYGHLDTLEGRYWIQLEWRALAAALEAPSNTSRRAAIAHALLFRRERQRRFPQAANEAALDIAEGVPEYTGVRLGLESPEARVRYAVDDLTRFLTAPSFVRAFAYASGPAYGLLLDEADPDWREELAGESAPADLLAAALDLHTLSDDDGGADQAARIYDPDGALRARELARDRIRRARLAEYRAALVDGPVVRLPFKGVRYQFNPQTLISLEEDGTVFPTFAASGPWGELEVEGGGALLAANRASMTITAAGLDASTLMGQGWRLGLSAGWALRPAGRPGDWEIVPAETPASTSPAPPVRAGETER